MIVDIGSETIRAGYSSNKSGIPEVEIYSIAGVQKLEDNSNKFYFDTGIRKPKEGMKLNPIIFDGLSRHILLYSFYRKLF